MAIVTDLEAVNQKVIDLMERHYGNRLANIVLYGSYARGDSDEESDIDYLIALYDESVSAFSELKHVSPILSELRSDSATYVSAVVVSKGQLTKSPRPFFKEVRKHGWYIV